MTQLALNGYLESFAKHFKNVKFQWKLLQICEMGTAQFVWSGNKPNLVEIDRQKSCKKSAVILIQIISPSQKWFLL